MQGPLSRNFVIRKYNSERKHGILGYNGTHISEPPIPATRSSIILPIFFYLGQ